MASTCASRPIASRLALICAALLWAAPLVAGPAGRSVITTRELPVAPDRVIRAFLDAEDLAGWWKVSRSLVEPEVGGVWSVSWDDWGEEKTQHSWTGVIEQLSAGRLVIRPMVMNEPGMPLLGPMTLEIRVDPTDGGSSVTVTHSGYGYGGHWDTIHELVVKGWDHVLGEMQAWFGQDY